MKPAPIQLLEYVTEEVAFEVNPTYRTGSAEEGQGETFAIQPEVLSYPEGEEAGELRLTVALNDEGDPFRYYRLRMTVLGRFKHVDPNPPVDRETVRRYYLASGLAILYGVVRGLVLHLCAASPYPRLVLPTVTFDEEVAELLEAGEDR